jgi:hypothetical protein
MVTRRLWLTLVLVVFLAACQGQAAPSAGTPRPGPSAEAAEPSTEADEEEAEPSPRSPSRSTPSDDYEDEDDEDRDEDEGKGDREGCPSDALHPKGMRLAERYDVPYDEVMGWFCDGFGFGEVNRAYSLSLKKGMSVEDIFAMREDGLGWGQIKKQLGVKHGGGPPDDRPDDGQSDD